MFWLGKPYNPLESWLGLLRSYLQKACCHASASTGSSSLGLYLRSLLCQIQSTYAQNPRLFRPCSRRTCALPTPIPVVTVHSEHTAALSAFGPSNLSRLRPQPCRLWIFVPLRHSFASFSQYSLYSMPHRSILPCIDRFCLIWTDSCTFQEKFLLVSRIICCSWRDLS